MAVSAVVGAVAVRSGMVAKQQLSWKTWAKICVPVGALSAAALFFGNMSFMYLTVSFMQMLKANMPVIIFIVGCLFATEVFTLASFSIMVVIAAGVGMASYGELNFSLLGVLCMFSAMSCEAVRLTLVQTLLQRQDLQLNPLSTLYYIMPISVACLLPIAFVTEARGLSECRWLTYHALPSLLANAGGAVALNLSIYIVVGTMSALTMKLAAIVKDIGLVAVSCALFGDTLTFPGVFGAVVLGSHPARSPLVALFPLATSEVSAQREMARTVVGQQSRSRWIGMAADPLLHVVVKLPGFGSAMFHEGFNLAAHVFKTCKLSWYLLFTPAAAIVKLCATSAVRALGI
ncbi:hypothetical protein WJX77_010550 [Trebouxia sp. C0004]